MTITKYRARIFFVILSILLSASLFVYKNVSASGGDIKNDIHVVEVSRNVDYVSYNTFSNGGSELEVKSKSSVYDLPSRNDQIFQLKLNSVDNLNKRKISEIIITTGGVKYSTVNKNYHPMDVIVYYLKSDSKYVYNQLIKSLDIDLEKFYSESGYIQLIIQPEYSEAFNLVGGKVEVKFNDGTSFEKDIEKNVKYEDKSRYYINNIHAYLYPLSDQDDYMTSDNFYPGKGKNGSKADWHYRITTDYDIDINDYFSSKISTISISNDDLFDSKKAVDSGCFTDKRSLISSDNMYPMLIKSSGYNTPKDYFTNVNVSGYQIDLYCQSGSLDFSNGKIPNIYIKNTDGVVYLIKNIVKTSKYLESNYNIYDVSINGYDWPKFTILNNSDTDPSLEVKISYDGIAENELTPFIQILDKNLNVVGSSISNKKIKSGDKYNEAVFNLDTKNIPLGEYTVYTGLYSGNNIYELGRVNNLQKDNKNRYLLENLIITDSRKNAPEYLLSIDEFKFKKINFIKSDKNKFEGSMKFSGKSTKDVWPFLHLVDKKGNLVKKYVSITRIPGSVIVSDNVDVTNFSIDVSDLDIGNYDVYAGVYNELGSYELNNKKFNYKKDSTINRYLVGSIYIASNSNEPTPTELPATTPNISKDISVYGISNSSNNNFNPGSVINYNIKFSGGPSLKDNKIFAHFINEEGEMVWKNVIVPTTPSTKWGLNGNNDYVFKLESAVPNNIVSGKYKILIGLYSESPKLSTVSLIPVDGAKLYDNGRYEVASFTINYIPKPPEPVFSITNISILDGKTKLLDPITLTMGNTYGVSWQINNPPYNSKFNISVISADNKNQQYGLLVSNASINTTGLEWPVPSYIPDNSNVKIVISSGGKEFYSSNLKIISKPEVPTATQPTQNTNNQQKYIQIIGSTSGISGSTFQLRVMGSEGSISSGDFTFGPYPLTSNNFKIIDSQNISFTVPNNIPAGVYDITWFGSNTGGSVKYTVTAPSTESNSTIQNVTEGIQVITPNSGKSGSVFKLKVVGATSGLKAEDFTFGPYPLTSNNFKVIDNENVSFTVPNNIPLGVYEIVWFGPNDTSTIKFTVTSSSAQGYYFLSSVINSIYNLLPKYITN